MEMIVVCCLCVLLIMFLGGIMGIVALSKVLALQNRVILLRRDFDRALSSRTLVIETAERVTRPTPVLAEMVPASSVPDPSPVVFEERRPQEVEIDVEVFDEEAPEAAASAVDVEVFASVGPPATEPAEQEPEPSSVPSFEPDWWKRTEERIGKRWITWAGVVALFIGAGFFVRHAMDQGWLGPVARVLLGGLFGAGLVTLGTFWLRKKMRPLGQGLIGGGLSVLYVALFAAFTLYQLLPYPLAFALMALVTVLGMGLAVAHDARVIGLLALLGGLGTPLMLWSGEEIRPFLLGYLLCLDLGVLAVAFVKRWRALDLIAWIGTWALLMISQSIHTDGTLLFEPLAWLTAFYAVFLVLPLVHHLGRDRSIPRERLVMVVTNGWLALGFVVVFLPETAYLLGFTALALSLSFVLVAWLARRMIPDDQRSVFSFVASAVMLLSLAVPLLLDLHAVTLAWAAEGVVLLYIGYRYSHLSERLFGLANLVLATGHLFVSHWPLHLYLHEGPVAPFANAEYGSAVLLAMAGGAFAAIHHHFRGRARDFERSIKLWCAFVSAYVFLVVTHAELWLWLTEVGWQEHVRWVTALLWSGGAITVLGAGWWLRSGHARILAIVTLAAPAVLLIWDYAQGWTPGQMLLLNGSVLAGLVSCAALIGMGFFFRHSVRCDTEEKALSLPLIGAGSLFLTLLAGVEWWQWSGETTLLFPRWAVLIAIWAAAAAASLAVSRGLEEPGLRVLFHIQVALASMLAVASFLAAPSGDGSLLLNWRYGAVLLVSLLCFSYSALSLNARRPEAIFYLGAGLLSVLLSLTMELWQWLDVNAGPETIRAALPALWAVGAAAFLLCGAKLRSLELRTMALIVLGIAGVLGPWSYAFPLGDGASIFLNWRFLPALCVVVTVFAHGGVLRSMRKREPDTLPDDLSRPLLGVGVALAVTLLSVETYLYFFETINDVDRARWIAHMALSLVWGFCAVVILAIGFWRRKRALRLVGLGLFGLTAVKLVLFDMGQVAGGYRVISFLAVGVMMIGASYVYHRVEAWLARHDGVA